MNLIIVFYVLYSAATFEVFVVSACTVVISPCGLVGGYQCFSEFLVHDSY